METYRLELLIIALMAALSPLLVKAFRHPRLPVVVAELLLGICIGPHALNLVNADGLLGVMGELGLTFLLFMVGLEINFNRIRGKPLALAGAGWIISLLTALACVSAARALGLTSAPLLTAIALSTTALGILAPILRDNGQLETPFGHWLIAAAAMGEIGPLLALAFIPTQTPLLNMTFMLFFAGVILLAAYAAMHVRSPKWMTILTESMQTSGQLPVRLCLALQALLIWLAAQFGFNVVLGAFAAGLVVNLGCKGEAGDLLKQKLDAIGYGFLIPFFFISAGMKFHLNYLGSSPLVVLQVAAVLGLMLLARGMPLFLYSKILPPRSKWSFALYSATGLPLIVIITELGNVLGIMTPDQGAVLISAGMLSVILFPLLAEDLSSQK